MSMSNYLYGGGVVIDTMAATNQPMGLNHLTVVPENFESDSDTCPSCGERLERDEDAQ